MAERVKITIVGAGVVGCAVAWRLAKKHDEIFVLDKNPRILSENQSSRNSGVIHAGIYYPRDESPLKAKLCVEGNRLLYDFCEEFDVPFRRTGKLVLAVSEMELDYLDDTLKIAGQNGVPGVRLISAGDARAMEPNVSCIKAAFVPTSGIVESTRLVHKLYGLASERGAYFLPSKKVVDIRPAVGAFIVTTQSGDGSMETFESEMVINSAGVYADEVARMINPESPWEVLPIRGEAAKFYRTRRPEIGHAGLNVYPTPHGIWPDGRKADVPFAEFEALYREKKVVKTVGVHLTPTFDLIEGRYEIGSTVTIGPATKGDISKEDLTNGLFPPEHFHSLVRRFFPNLNVEDLDLHQAGIQSKLKDFHDYVVEPDPRHPRFINLLGVDSPGLTSSLAIARLVEETVSAVG